MAIFSYATKQDQLTTIMETIMHEGLLTYHPKASNAPLDLQRRAKQLDKLHKKGAVFAVRDKSHFENGVKGFIITSNETLINQADQISHFTPNVYRRYHYADDKRRMIKGFEEKNLLQINTFVIDIDTQRHSVNQILLTCIDDSIGEPTLILKTTRGYQVYFVLAEPIFISNNRNFLSLNVAKRIADNLKRSLATVDADMYCNDFGFFRTPNHQNVVWFNEHATYQPAKLIDWSQRIDDDKGRQLFVVPTKAQSESLLTSEWFMQLLQTTDVKGEKGQIGRNNYLFTLALVCYQDGRDQSYTFDLLDQFNSRLRTPLSVKDVEIILESAYSGRYHGPKKEYIEQLIELYAPQHADINVSFGKTVWYKHKKVREDRERSHLQEWEEDIEDWIMAKKSISEPFIWHTQKELCNEIGISNSSLNKLLKQSKKLLKTTTGKGRNAKTGWTTVGLYIDYIIWLKQDMGERFATSIRALVAEQIDIMEPVAGYDILTTNLKKFGQEQLATEQLSMQKILASTG